MSRSVIKQAISLVVIISKYVLVSLTAFSIFGLMLAIAWSLPISESIHYKLIATTMVASLSIVAGGYMMGKLTQGHKPILQSSEWGLLIGFVGFGYIFSIDWKWLAALFVSGILATLGGWISQRK